ncbi:uncharacterized protein CANTADRAFT_4328 [Suhomyces tanzawaensis NRRL Y-17324]|uniref:Stb3p n=1 Tax=Suhomyces tanzawaensis NRRL Y-17324 TaxID=984487 RepID=A0A1E4SSC2_9ASCO|nr:uncharacterized protein CANTADRAFT_4328 [Suhomyces tanzawaensis NRRL Y-17324]ODV82317.1 hypothetical protein CANTADRAFT_4328 [Suhomyces tanzawaensis NRRL Y-17324]
MSKDLSAKAPRKLLSTSSPEGILVASKITPTRLANLLIRKGPLPIRHITSQLALEVPSFDFLSLSKQRRLIMAAMEQTDPSNNVVFEKIGWGQWAVRKTDSDFIVTEGTEARLEEPSVEASDPDSTKINVNDLRNQANVKLGWAKKASPASRRRESITNAKTNLHNVKLPEEPDSNAIASDSEDEYGLSDNVEMDEDDDDDDDEEEDELFAFDHDESINKFKRSPPIQFAKRVPIKISPPPGHETGPSFRHRRKSSSSNPNSSISKIPNYRHQLFNRSRLNSLDNLDNYIMSSSKNSNVSISSPPPAQPQFHPYYSSASAANSILSASPVGSWNGNNNYIHHSASATSPESIAATMNTTNRRKSSFNESHLRSTLSTSVPKNNPATPTLSAQQLTQPSNSPKIANLLNKPYENEYLSQSTLAVIKKQTPELHVRSYSASGAVNQSDTDEEDWATIGAETLRKTPLKLKNRIPRSPTSKPNHPRQKGHSRQSSLGSNVDVNEEERSAAFALVDLRSV